MPKMLNGKAVRCQRGIAWVRSVVLHRLFSALYGPGARIYDRFTRLVFAGEWHRWQLTALGALSPGGVVVELGSGTGTLAAAAARFPIWIGLDVSPQMLAVARQRQRPPAPMFVRASAVAMPLRTGRADAVVATFPSNYVFEQRALDEVRRVLKLDGRFVVVLTGELDGVGARRRSVRALTKLLQGPNEATEARMPSLAGFTGQWEWVRTEFGRALLYVGFPLPTQDDDCSPQPGDAGGRV